MNTDITNSPIPEQQLDLKLTATVVAKYGFVLSFYLDGACKQI